MNERDEPEAVAPIQQHVVMTRDAMMAFAVGSSGHGEGAQRAELMAAPQKGMLERDGGTRRFMRLGRVLIADPIRLAASPYPNKTGVLEVHVSGIRSFPRRSLGMQVRLAKTASIVSENRVGYSTVGKTCVIDAYCKNAAVFVLAHRATEFCQSAFGQWRSIKPGGQNRNGHFQHHFCPFR